MKEYRSMAKECEKLRSLGGIYDDLTQSVYTKQMQYQEVKDKLTVAEGQLKVKDEQLASLKRSHEQQLQEMCELTPDNRQRTLGFWDRSKYEAALLEKDDIIQQLRYELSNKDEVIDNLEAELHNTNIRYDQCKFEKYCTLNENKLLHCYIDDQKVEFEEKIDSMSSKYKSEIAELSRTLEQRTKYFNREIQIHKVNCQKSVEEALKAALKSDISLSVVSSQKRFVASRAMSYLMNKRRSIRKCFEALNVANIPMNDKYLTWESIPKCESYRVRKQKAEDLLSIKNPLHFVANPGPQQGEEGSDDYATSDAMSGLILEPSKDGRRVSNLDNVPGLLTDNGDDDHHHHQDSNVEYRRVSVQLIGDDNDYNASRKKSSAFAPSPSSLFNEQMMTVGMNGNGNGNGNGLSAAAAVFDDDIRSLNSDVESKFIEDIQYINDKFKQFSSQIFDDEDFGLGQEQEQEQVRQEEDGNGCDVRIEPKNNNPSISSALLLDEPVGVYGRSCGARFIRDKMRSGTSLNDSALGPKAVDSLNAGSRSSRSSRSSSSSPRPDSETKRSSVKSKAGFAQLGENITELFSTVASSFSKKSAPIDTEEQDEEGTDSERGEEVEGQGQGPENHEEDYKELKQYFDSVRYGSTGGAKSLEVSPITPLTTGCPASFSTRFNDDMNTDTGAFASGVVSSTTPLSINSSTVQTPASEKSAGWFDFSKKNSSWCSFKFAQASKQSNAA